MAAYRLSSVAALKVELAKRGAVTTGRKETLVDRLESYDRNLDFRGTPIVLPEPVKFNWPITGFHQLHSQHKLFFPKLQSEQIEGYFRYRIAGDHQCVDDIKAIEKGRRLFESSKVLACSVNRSDNDIFLTGLVGAAMKKHVTYSYKLKLGAQRGEVYNSDCECPAGKGPHGTCKHLAAVLLMLQHFVETGDVQVAKTCTENLQQFHTPKQMYEGSPVKAEQLCPSARKKCKTDDPRPAMYRNMPGYTDHVHNTLINFCSLTSKDIPMRYLIPQANIQSAAMDHDYLDLPFTEHWVMNGVSIDEKQALEIESKTKGQQMSKLWYEERRWRITASRFGDICKMTEARDRQKLCKSILGHSALTKPAVLHGRQYEGKAVKLFEAKTGLKVTKAGLFVRHDLPYLGASPDGLIATDSTCIVEVKCPYTGRENEITPCKLFPFLQHDENKELQLKPSSKYFTQIQGQMYLSKRQHCYFVVYTFKDLFIEKVPLDVKYCEESMLPKLDVFYQKYFRKYVADQL